MIRTIGLIASDILAGLAGVYTALETWPLVSNGGLRPLPNEIPLLAMVFCLQPMALRIVGAYRGGRARTDFLRIAGGIAIAALLGWIQARLFGRVPPLPDKAAFTYSAVLICGYAWVARLALDWVIAQAYARGILQRRVLVVGTPRDVQELTRPLLAARLGVPQRGRTADAERRKKKNGPGKKKDGRPLRDALSSAKARAVVIVSSLPLKRLETLIDECFALGASVEVLPQALRRTGGADRTAPSRSGAFLHLHPLRVDLPQLAIKRTMDLVLTLGV